MSKHFEEDSVYEKYDLDHDGVISDDELAHAKIIRETENELRKQRAQRRMATAALVAMIAFNFIMFTPLISIERINALTSLSDHFNISMAGITAAYLGTSAWIQRK